MDGAGNRVFNMSQIREMVVAFFQNLLGSVDDEIQDISLEALRDLLSYRCPQEISEQLVSIPTDEAIKSVIFAMPKNKAPGPDGFSAEFFLGVVGYCR